MQKQLNLKVKYRESFRPFAPSVLNEDVGIWFNHKKDSPYMLLVAEVNKSKCLKINQEQKNLFGIDKLNVSRSEIPAVTHVDYSARIQTVHKNTNLRYHALISSQRKDWMSLIINTSFNIRGEPLVCSPTDAFHCFMGTELDILVIDNFFMIKKEQKENLRIDYKGKYALD